ncbi:hypothetical protein AVEN_45197-1 [Araneus ventricosus]|uniref:Uncharacterized protein n=1 Tax=Araneus ventricosus TaxID=182803 RepID=A0A4Y2N419_ARAVE|nr:hypothetical protein AVEN_45197-1 [Araneus ventricosus]
MSGVWGFSRGGRIVVKPRSYRAWLKNLSAVSITTAIRMSGVWGFPRGGRTVVKPRSYGAWLKNLSAVSITTAIRMSGVWGFSRAGRIVVKPCSYGAWLGKSVGSARVNGCTDAVCPLPLPLMCVLSTALTRETTYAHTSPRPTSILPVPTTGNDANC